MDVNNNTPAAQELAQRNTVAQLRDMIQTEFGTQAPSKLRKLELAQYLDDLRANEQAAQEQSADAYQRALAEQYAATVGEPQVFQGAMHEVSEDTVGNLMRQAVEESREPITQDDVTVEFGDLAASVRQVEHALKQTAPTLREAAQQVAKVAYANLVAMVRSMGRTVTGKVVDVVLREPTPGDKDGRVLLVVQHDGYRTRRTLHKLAEVDLKPVAS